MKTMWSAVTVMALVAAAVSPVAADTLISGSTDGSTFTVPGQTSSNLVGAGGILDSLYGMGSLTRVSDVSDQMWALNGGATGALATAAYAGYSNNFGVLTGALGSNNPLAWNVLTVPANTFGTTPGIAAGAFTTGATLAESLARYALLSSGPFRLGLDPNGPGGAPGTHSSRASENEDGIDHMVTFRYVDASGTTHFLVGWEDLQGGGDYDYNDLVLDLVGVHPVPEPGTMALLGAGVMGLLAYSRRRKLQV